MRVGLLQCDHVSPENQPEFGDYSDFFLRLFQDHAPETVLEVYDVQQDEYPADPNRYDGFIGTGSSHSVWEDLPWIQRLKEFLRNLYDGGNKFIGICFGHQMIAEALGGKCEHSDRGWGVGVKKVRICLQKDWMIPGQKHYHLLYSHQDQISRLPEDSEVLGGNEHCPFSMIAVGGHFLGIQGHPEFTPAYLRRLMGSRIDRIGEKTVNAAENTLKKKTDEAVITQWMAAFFRQ